MLLDAQPGHLHPGVRPVSGQQEEKGRPGAQPKQPGLGLGQDQRSEMASEPIKGTILFQTPWSQRERRPKRSRGSGFGLGSLLAGKLGWRQAGPGTVGAEGWPRPLEEEGGVRVGAW